MMSRASCPHSQTYRVQLSLWDHVQRLTTTTLIFLRDCVECLLLHQGKPDNQTCHHQCKDEVITWVDTIVKDDQEAVLCFYKTAKDCVMMFSYTELPNGRSNLTVLREPGT